jgi:hypothetical protein
MNRTSAISGFFAMVLMAGLLTVTYFAGRRGLADVVAQEPRYEIERWRIGKSAPDSVRLNALQAELHKAWNLDPGNPNLLDDLGRFHAARVARDQPYDMLVRESRQQSLTYFRRALELRPTSGHAYVNIALSKFRLGEIDQEFTWSLEQALYRSPWEPQVQLIAIELGIASWQALSDSTRQKLQQAIHAQGQWKLADQKPQLLTLFKRYRRSDLNCLLEPGPDACDAS